VGIIYVRMASLCLAVVCSSKCSLIVNAVQMHARYACPSPSKYLHTQGSRRRHLRLRHHRRLWLRLRDLDALRFRLIL
jgi:hypothetical protein